MATQRDVRRIALSLPGSVELEDRFPFSARVPNPEVLGIRVANEDAKQVLLEAAPKKFFTEPHYNGYPAVLVRLKGVTVEELRSLLVSAWKCQAPKALLKAFNGSR
jgi:hypothetical protein